MSEPVSAAGGANLAVIFVAALGPMAGPYAVIVFAALAGSLWPLSSSRTNSSRDSVWLLVRCTGTSIVLTGLCATLLERVVSIPVTELLAPVALVIAAMGNGWRPVFAGVGAAVGAAVGKGEVRNHD